jgi:hypothetical protein
MRPRLEDEDHGETGGTVEASHPPPFADPDIGLFWSMAGTALGLVVSVPRRLHENWIIQLLDAQVAFEGKCGPGGEAWKGARYLGHDPTLATGHTDVFPLLDGAVRRG